VYRAQVFSWCRRERRYSRMEWGELCRRRTTRVIA
jgi:hypothetical protein